MALGADALGFVLEPSSPRCVAPEALGWLTELPEPVRRVAVFGPFLPERVPAGVQAIQSLDEVPLDLGLGRMRALAVRADEDWEVVAARFDAAEASADAVVLDAHAVGAYGGTGRRVDLELARALVERARKPVVLAGGLTPDNVAEAIRAVRPWSVDVSSGIESAPGVKDPGAMRAFIATAREALPDGS